MIYIYYYKNGKLNRMEKPDWNIKHDCGSIIADDGVASWVVYLSQMSNPYIYAEAGITEQDINDYETANVVPVGVWGVQSKTLTNTTLEGGLNHIELSDGMEFIRGCFGNSLYSTTVPDLRVFNEPEPKQCTCESRDLFNYGCKCGGV